MFACAQRGRAYSQYLTDGVCRQTASARHSITERYAYFHNYESLCMSVFLRAVSLLALMENADLEEKVVNSA
jgi:hypothetical protein